MFITKEYKNGDVFIENDNPFIEFKKDNIIYQRTITGHDGIVGNRPIFQVLRVYNRKNGQSYRAKKLLDIIR